MKHLILNALGCFLLLGALLSASAGAWYVHAGANPPPGGGSLGHVGMVIAGVVLLGASVLFGPVGWFLLRKASRSDRSASLPTR